MRHPQAQQTAAAHPSSSNKKDLLQTSSAPKAQHPSKNTQHESIESPEGLLLPLVLSHLCLGSGASGDGSASISLPTIPRSSVCSREEPDQKERLACTNPCSVGLRRFSPMGVEAYLAVHEENNLRETTPASAPRLLLSTFDRWLVWMLKRQAESSNSHQKEAIRASAWGLRGACISQQSEQGGGLRQNLQSR